MAPSGATSISIKYIILTAAIIGTFQAATWFSLSLVSILFYESAIEIDTTSQHEYGNYIYNYYLNRNNPNGENYIIYPETFNYFMWIYLVLSFIWLVSSCFILWAVVRGKWKNMSKLIIFWSSITIAIAVTDIILMSLVAADLQKAHDLSNNPTETTTETTTKTTTETTTETTIVTSTTVSTTVDPSLTSTIPKTTSLPDPTIEVPQGRYLQLSENLSTVIFPQSTYTSMGIVMTLAARGYVLWCINVILAIVLIVLVRQMKKMNRPTLLPPIDAFDTRTRPFTLYDQTDIGTGHDNNGFTVDDDIIFSPKRTVVPTVENISRNPLSNSNRSSINDSQPYIFSTPRPIEIARPFRNDPTPMTKLAKIGKSGRGRRTPPQSVPSPVPPSNVPYIPDPDYTPPISPEPQTKSVLKPRSKYIF
ncbi:uncharacterized protein isoform X3 [Leptinotarsa decemlineata]|uniref:uncharacterized protein isoform X3 n=1 Tax=Leptinotarsa decemlineata TaxID=7539 RepID=UPI003D30C08E